MLEGRGQSSNEIGLIGEAPVYAAPDYIKCENPIYYTEGKGIRFCLCLRAEAIGGNVSKDESGLHITEASEVTIYLSGKTNFDVRFPNCLSEGNEWKKEADRCLWESSQKGFSCLKEEHVKRHRSFFERVELELWDDRF